MRFFVICVFVSILALSACGQADEPVAPIDKAVVVELFTSQSCSSCPPADALLKKLAANPKVITLGCHVTYWNHLSWQDTLSLDACTERQRGYDQFFNKGVYTPQMVINGGDALIGSRQKAVEASIAKAAAVKPVFIEMRGQRVSVSLVSDFGKGPYFLTLFGILREHHQDIARGENGGRRIGYTSPVTEVLSLGEWQGDTRGISADLTTEADGVVVLIQDPATWRVVGAGRAYKIKN